MTCGCFQKYGKTPQIIHFNRVWNLFHHPFWGFSPYLWGDIHVLLIKTKSKVAGFSAKKYQHGRTSLCSRWCFSRGHRDFFWGWWSMAWIAMGPIFCGIYAPPAPSKVPTKLIKHLFSSKTSQFSSPKTIQNNLKNRTCLQRFEGFFGSDSWHSGPNLLMLLEVVTAQTKHYEGLICLHAACVYHVGGFWLQCFSIIR